jgi:TolB protein
MLRLVLIVTVQGMGLLLLGIGGVLEIARQSPATSSWIAFVSYRDGDGEIYLMRSDGSGQRRLTYRSGDDYAPGWLDQDTLFFLGNLQTLYCLNLDRSDYCPITQRSMTRSSTLSPDGQWLLTLSNTEGNWEIY